MPHEVCDVCGAPAPVVRKPANWRQALWGGWTCPQCRSEFDRWGRNLGVTASRRKTWTLDNTSYATSPGRLTLSDEKLRLLRPDLYVMSQRLRELVGLAFPQRTYLREQLQNGDSHAAVVISTSPLLVAAYSEELDCVAILEFPIELVADYRLQVGTKLLTVNTYRSEPQIDADLVRGPHARDHWTGFSPLIADFVSTDDARIKARKQEITREEWTRAYQLARDYLKAHPGVARDGRPVHCGGPASWEAEQERS